MQYLLWKADIWNKRSEIFSPPKAGFVHRNLLICKACQIYREWYV